MTGSRNDLSEPDLWWKQRGLRDIRLRLRRAQEHLNSIKRNVQRYIDSTPYERVTFPLNERVTDSRSDQNLVYGIKVTEQPPPRIAIFVGECIQNIHSALDYLACQLVLINGRHPNAHTAFPLLVEKPSVLEDALKRIGVRRMQGQAQAVIERLQPCNAPNPTSHPLALLYELSRINKHRYLSVGTFFLPNAEHVATSAVASILVEDRVVSGPVVFRTNMFNFDSPVLDSDEVDVQVKAAMQVAFEEAGELGYRDVISTLEEILKFVRHTILPGFEPFFDSDIDILTITIPKRGPRRT